jgi:hypothetical protein
MSDDGEKLYNDFFITREHFFDSNGWTLAEALLTMVSGEHFIHEIFIQIALFGAVFAVL